MIKLLVGILKGAVIGGALGYGAFALQQATGFGNPWLTYGVIGAIVGLFVGKPFWSLIRNNMWIAILKSVFGFGIGCGLYALVAKVWGGSLFVEAIGYDVFAWPPTLGGAIGAVYGGFVELDDAIGDDKTPPAKPTKPTAPTAKEPKQIAKK